MNQNVNTCHGNHNVFITTLPDRSITKMNSCLLLNAESPSWGKKLNMTTSFCSIPSEASWDKSVDWNENVTRQQIHCIFLYLSHCCTQARAPFLMESHSFTCHHDVLYLRDRNDTRNETSSTIYHMLLVIIRTHNGGISRLFKGLNGALTWPHKSEYKRMLRVGLSIKWVSKTIFSEPSHQIQICRVHHR